MIDLCKHHTDPPTTSDPGNGDGGQSTAEIVVEIIGSLIGLIIAISCCILCCRYCINNTVAPAQDNDSTTT